MEHDENPAESAEIRQLHNYSLNFALLIIQLSIPARRFSFYITFADGHSDGSEKVVVFLLDVATPNQGEFLHQIYLRSH